MDDTGTKATEDRLHQLNSGLENGMDSSKVVSSKAASLPVQDSGGDVPINENLFLDEDLDEELENLDLED